MSYITLALVAAVAFLVGAVAFFTRRAPPSPKSAAPVPRENAAVVAPPVIAPPPLADDPTPQLHSLALGLPGPAGTPPTDADKFIARVRERLTTVVSQPKYMPRKPMLLPELMRAINDDATSRSELTGIIARDPALAGDLLKLANSGFYRTSPQPVESLERAVALLGTNGIRSLISVAILQPVFRVPAGAFARFPDVIWDHASRSAVSAEIYASIIDSSDPFAAQLLGLLMGLGAIVVFRVASDVASDRSEPPSAATLAALLATDTASVAASIAHHWGLSDRFPQALLHQLDAEAAERDALARALRFGQTLGALAVLTAHHRIDTDSAKAVMRARGCSDHHFDRIWQRLTAH